MTSQNRHGVWNHHEHFKQVAKSTEISNLYIFIRCIRNPSSTGKFPLQRGQKEILHWFSTVIHGSCQKSSPFIFEEGWSIDHLILIGLSDGAFKDIDRSGSCCSIGYPTEIQLINSTLAKSRLSITYFTVAQPFWNFAQSTAVKLSCSVQNVKTTWQRNLKLWTNENWD